jgi:hypothetical protein
MSDATITRDELARLRRIEAAAKAALDFYYRDNNVECWGGHGLDDLLCRLAETLERKP